MPTVIANFEVLDGSSFRATPPSDTVFDVAHPALFRQHLVGGGLPVFDGAIENLAKSAGRTDAHFVFDVSALPDDAEITAAVLKLTARAASRDEGHSTHPAHISVRDRDDIWNTETGLTSTSWRGSKNLDVWSELKLSGGGDAVNNQGNAAGLVESVVHYGRWPTQTGHTLEQCQEIGEYFKAADAGPSRTIDKIKIRIASKVGIPTGTLVCELYSAKVGGGGQHNREPDTLLATSATLNVSDQPMPANFAVFQMPDPQESYALDDKFVFVLKHSMSGNDEDNYLVVSIVGKGTGGGDNGDEDGNLLFRGNDRGFTPNNYIDGHVDSVDPLPPIFPTSAAITSDIPTLAINDLWTSDDISTMLKVAQADPSFNTEKRFCVRVSGELYDSDNSGDFFEHKATGLSSEDPQLEITYTVGAQDIIISP